MTDPDPPTQTHMHFVWQHLAAFAVSLLLWLAIAALVWTRWLL